MSLNRSELRSWLVLIRGVQALLDALDRQLREEAGISHDDYRILSSLYRSPDGKRRMSELAREMSYSPSRLSHAAARLERQGWVTRSKAEKDRRGVRIELTDAGADKARTASVGHLALVSQLVFETSDVEQLGVVVDTFHRIGRAAERR